MKIEDINEGVRLARLHLEEKHGSNSIASPTLPDKDKVVVMGEEQGEICRAVLENDYDQLRKELLQVAACAIGWLECL